MEDRHPSDIQHDARMDALRFSKGSCFVIMPITPPEERLSTYSDGALHFAHVLDYLFTPVLESCEYKPIPPSASGSRIIHADIIENLEQADLVLCDISCLNPNVFFELGIRTALDKPVAIVKDDYTKHIPFDTLSINTYTYASSLAPWSLETDVPNLIEHIKSSVERANGRNSMWRYFGLTQRAAPAEIEDPRDAKLSLILEEVTKLNQSRAEELRKLNQARMEELQSRMEDLTRTARTPSSEPSEVDHIIRHHPDDPKVTTKRAYSIGLAVGHETRLKSTPNERRKLISKKPAIPEDIEAKFVEISTMPPDVILHNPEIRRALRQGFWTALE